ncbi:hypothetical protein ACIQUY_32730, partial [Streptomyces sp. NPDC090231]|uniref:hypothetical protein n=1 Tax=unclassified Streptomyces TaxID=2593676 RepID=UPI003823DE90
EALTWAVKVRWHEPHGGQTSVAIGQGSMTPDIIVRHGVRRGVTQVTQDDAEISVCVTLVSAVQWPFSAGV